MRGRFRTIQNNSGLPQGPGPPFGGSLMVRRSMRAICDPRRSHHETAGGRGAAGLGCRHHGSRVLFGPDPRGDIAVGIHSRLSARLRRRPARAPTGGRKRHARQGAARIHIAARHDGRLAPRGARAAAGAAGRRPCQPPAAELAKPFHCMPSLDRWAPARCVRAPIRRVQKGLSEVGSILHHERERIRPSTLVGLA